MTYAQEQLLLELARFNIVTMRNWMYVDPVVLRRAVDKLELALKVVELDNSMPNHG